VIRGRAWIALALVCLAARVATAEELSPQDYLGELTRARKVLERELESARDGRDLDAVRLRGETARLHGAVVKTPGGPIAVDPGLDRDVAALEELESPSLREEKLDEITHRIEALERSARRAQGRTASPDPRAQAPDSTRPGDAARPTAEAAREAFARVLERPEYRKRTVSEAESSGLADRVESLLQRFWNWVERLFKPGTGWTPPYWLQWLLSVLAALVPTGWLGYVGWAIVAALVIGLILLVHSKRRAFQGVLEREEGPLVDLGLEGEAPPMPDESYSEAQWRREARRLADRGEYRGAVRALYTGLLLLLQRGGRLKFDRGKTNWEHLRELRRSDKRLAARLEPLTRTFDVVWYGQMPIERGTFDQILGESDELARSAEIPPSIETSP
jgi:hypothetical protein